jgi:hypothetical protein
LNSRHSFLVLIRVDPRPSFFPQHPSLLRNSNPKSISCKSQ